MLNLLDDGLRGDAVQAGPVASLARLLAVDAAWAAVEGHLHGVLYRLSPAHESCVGVGGTPDADNGRSRERGQVHVAGVHRHHDAEVAHEDELLPERGEMAVDADALWVLLAPLAKVVLLLLAPSEEVDADVGVAFDELFDHLVHQLRWIGLALVGRKGGYADTQGTVVLHVGRQQCYVALAVAEDAAEVHLYGVAQLGEHVDVVLSCCTSCLWLVAVMRRRPLRCLLM